MGDRRGAQEVHGERRIVRRHHRLTSEVHVLVVVDLHATDRDTAHGAHGDKSSDSGAASKLLVAQRFVVDGEHIVVGIHAQPPGGRALVVVAEARNEIRNDRRHVAGGGGHGWGREDRYDPTSYDDERYERTDELPVNTTGCAGGGLRASSAANLAMSAVHPDDDPEEDHAERGEGGIATTC